ncbi:uncharacterized protein [Dermacentor albipictus]|uniref:uncharacterized protein isoform X1 n=1 Tax=Dermacentor albipictus TaxID=60249 RepID=UPI0038FCF27C
MGCRTANVCLMLLGALGVAAGDLYWNQGLRLPSACFGRNAYENKCEELLRTSHVYRLLQKLYERSPSGRDNFRAKVRSCALEVMTSIDFHYLCDSMKFSRKAVICTRKVAASIGPPRFKARVRALYNKYWECMQSLFEQRKKV